MKVKSIVLEKILTTERAIFFVLFSVIIFAPFFGVQTVTGPLVNAALFLATALIGVRGATLLAVFPSLLALAVGFLPGPMIMLVPFIITGNIILILVFNYFKENYWGGVVASSLAKFFFLFTSAHIISNLFLTGNVAKIATTIMSFPQLITALTGGVIAYFVLTILKNKKIV